MHALITIVEGAIESMLARERALFAQRNPKSQELAARTGPHWLRGVPMLWMADWQTPFPLFIARAEGVSLTDADGNRYVDFCLGDTGAMFGHSPKPVAEALRSQARLGLTTMLPSPDAPIVGELLANRFNLPFWQIAATASDANRSLLRWARAATGRAKILVFNGAYHGSVDETFVRLEAGSLRPTPGLIGEPRDLTALTKVVEFNDADALQQALEPCDVACVLAEPVMTNCGMVLPAEGFHDVLRDLTRATGTILIMDETHSISSGPGGYCGAFGLEPDAIVLGKPVAGGVPAAAYGISQAFMQRIEAYLASRGEAHYSGIGTTLAGSPLQLSLMRRVLETYFTAETYEPLLRLAERLETGIARVIRSRRMPWHVVRVGARVEFMCTPRPPANGGQALQAIHRPVDRAVHHYLLNRGIVITPFHNMMLICPSTRKSHVDALVQGLDDCLHELLAAA